MDISPNNLSDAMARTEKREQVREVHKGPVGEKAAAKAREAAKDPDTMDIGKVACTYCRKLGHLAAACYRKKTVDERRAKGFCFKCGKPEHVS